MPTRSLQHGVRHQTGTLAWLREKPASHGEAATRASGLPGIVLGPEALPVKTSSDAAEGVGRKKLYKQDEIELRNDTKPLDAATATALPGWWE